MIQILNTILFFSELLSILIALWVSFRTESKYVEISMLSYLLFLLFIRCYQLENLKTII